MLNDKLIRIAKRLVNKQDYVPVLLSCDFCNGLGQLRSHGRKGIKSIGIGVSPSELSFKSRFCVPWLVDPDELCSKSFIAQLIELGRALGGKGYLSISSEQFLEYAVQHERALSEVFTIPVSLKKLNHLQDKEIQLRLAMDAGLDVPKTQFLDSNRLIDSGDIEGFRFPLFVRAKKRAKEFYGEYGIQGIKVRTIEELEVTCRKYGKYPLIIQEYIDGPDSDRYNFGSLVTATGQIVGYEKKLVRPVRKHGSASLSITIENNIIRKKSITFLRWVNYRGVSDMAYKYDIKTGKYYFIEINNRLTKSHSLAQACGLNLAYLQYLDAIGEKIVIPDGAPRTGVRWWLIFSDLWLVLKLVKDGKMQWRDFLSGLGMPFVSGIGSWDDPLPELYNFFTFRWKR